MAGYGKSAATSYSDFYSKNGDTSTPNTNDNPDLGTNPPKPGVMTPAARRRAALQRKLKKMKVAQ